MARYSLPFSSLLVGYRSQLSHIATRPFALSFCNTHKPTDARFARASR